MPFAFIENGVISQYPVGFYELKNKFPEADIPSPMEGNDLSEFGVVEVEATPYPEIDHRTHYFVEKPPILDGSIWRQCWEIIERSEEEKKAVEEYAINNARYKRNQLLSSSDWKQLADSPSDKAQWAEYRQALRDITKQIGFPWEVDWPEEPA
ncbi:MAG: tail fiber assembly protein [Candidatus Nanopelagicaceae bacterium]